MQSTLESLIAVLEKHAIKYEVLVINDHSKDHTETILKRLMLQFKALHYINNPLPSGFGFAIQTGLNHFTGDVVVPFMADASDSPEDVVAFFKKIQDGHDCVFGSRFMKKSHVVDYPKFKLVLNRIVNTVIRIMFGIRYNDVTNAFKMYRRSTVDGLKPFLSHHFNMTVELPLKAIARNYSYAVLPNSWINRKTGVSKLHLKEMGSRYLFIILYCLIEKWLSVGDYKKKKK